MSCEITKSFFSIVEKHISRQNQTRASNETVKIGSSEKGKESGMNAAHKAWKTRRANALAEKRSKAAKKAWVTRRAIAAIFKEDLEHCSLLPKSK